MFEKIVIKPFFLSRHRAAPLARERELFLAWLHRGGNGLGNLKITACYLLQVVRFLRLKAPRDVAQDEVVRAAKSWATDRGPNSRHSPGRHSEVLFARIARRWLRFQGRLLPRPPDPQPFSNILDDFVGYMRTERGLAPITIEGCRFRAAQFLAWFSKRHRQFSEVSIHDLDRYLTTRPRTWTLVTRAGVHSLRRESWIMFGGHSGRDEESGNPAGQFRSGRAEMERNPPNVGIDKRDVPTEKACKSPPLAVRVLRIAKRRGDRAPSFGFRLAERYFFRQTR